MYDLPNLGHVKFAMNTEDTVLMWMFNPKIWRSNRILGYSCERYWQICQRSHADPRGRESFGEARCKDETNIKTAINKWLGLYS